MCNFFLRSGYTSVMSYGSTTLIALVSRPIVRTLKPINILVLAIWVECARELIYSYVE